MFDAIFKPLVLFVERPLLALVPAAIFLGACVHVWLADRQSSRESYVWACVLTLMASCVWAVYAAYESHMHQWAKTVSNPIRVDLLLIAPLLWLVTVPAVACYLTELVRYIRQRRRGERM